MVLGQKAMKAINYIGALPIFAKHLNQYFQVVDETGYIILQEPVGTLHGCRQEIMWALGESLHTFAPDVKVHFKSNVVNVDCKKAEIETEGEVAGKFSFGLIIGADGVGS